MERRVGTLLQARLGLRAEATGAQRGVDTFSIQASRANFPLIADVLMKLI